MRICGPPFGPYLKDIFRKRVIFQVGVFPSARHADPVKSGHIEMKSAQ